MPSSRMLSFRLSALVGTVAEIVRGARCESDRADAIRDKVEVQDWESAPIKPAVPGAKIPDPEQVARDVTGIPSA